MMVMVTTGTRGREGEGREEGKGKIGKSLRRQGKALWGRQEREGEGEGREGMREGREKEGEGRERVGLRGRGGPTGKTIIHTGTQGVNNKVLEGRRNYYYVRMSRKNDKEKCASKAL